MAIKVTYWNRYIFYFTSDVLLLVNLRSDCAPGKVIYRFSKILTLSCVMYLFDVRYLSSKKHSVYYTLVKLAFVSLEK